MPLDPAETLYYRRARFSTRLPRTRFYVRAHYWLEERGADVWRIGLTRFATRMLGDLVEYSFDRQAGDGVEVGQNIGWIEGFKAVSDIFCAVKGEFVRANPALERDTTLVDNDPYDVGWLYEVRGEPDPDRLDVDGYINLLDATIDRMLSQTDEGGAACPVPGTS
jgi:glycine cleavage system H protein